MLILIFSLSFQSCSVTVLRKYWPQTLVKYAKRRGNFEFQEEITTSTSSRGYFFPQLKITSPLWVFHSCLGSIHPKIRPRMTCFCMSQELESVDTNKTNDDITDAFIKEEITVKWSNLSWCLTIWSLWSFRLTPQRQSLGNLCPIGIMFIPQSSLKACPSEF